jgi:hypothetical protein
MSEAPRRALRPEVSLEKPRLSRWSAIVAVVAFAAAAITGVTQAAFTDAEWAVSENNELATFNLQIAGSSGSVWSDTSLDGVNPDTYFEPDGGTLTTPLSLGTAQLIPGVTSAQQVIRVRNDSTANARITLQVAEADEITKLTQYQQAFRNLLRFDIQVDLTAGDLALGVAQFTNRTFTQMLTGVTVAQSALPGAVYKITVTARLVDGSTAQETNLAQQTGAHLNMILTGTATA